MLIPKLSRSVVRSLALSGGCMLFLLLTVSCASSKKVPYLVGAEELDSAKLARSASVFEARIIPKDVLTIAINTTDPAAAAPFNLGSEAGSGVVITGTSGLDLQTYVVDNNGNIEFPVVGTLHVGGLTRVQVQELVKSKLYPQYIKEEPVVNVRFRNYKVSVLGEVSRPGSFTVSNERCTVFDALAQAGDLTIYGKRNNVLLIREKSDGQKELYRIDLQDPELVMQPDLYYLHQNDVLYVEPNKTKSRTSAIGSSETFLISIVSTLVSISTLLVTILR